MEIQYLSWAVILGALSAASLPLGSLLGLHWHPNNRVTAAFTAFGGGALIAALAVELVAPTSIHLMHAQGEAARTEATHHLINLLVGAVVGGVLFAALGQIVNSKGGFLRKTSATITYFTSRKANRRKYIIKQLAASELVRHLPLELVEEIVTSVNERTYDADEQLFAEGDEGDVVYFIESGNIEVTQGGEVISNLEPGDVLGEIALITGSHRTATATAKYDSSLFSLPKENFDYWRKKSPKFDQAAVALASDRLQVLTEKQVNDPNAEKWTEEAILALPSTTVVPTETQLQEVSEEHDGAPMAIWLGILLDGIPESFVIGSALVVTVTAAVTQYGVDAVGFTSIIPYTLIAGLFLANFPEAMSSSIGMQKQGWSRLRIFLMWFSLMVMTSIGAGLGYWLGGSINHGWVVAIEGLAAGAMLTMIASAMIPESVHLGGSTITGLSTLSGFLSAIAFKLLE